MTTYRGCSRCDALMAEAEALRLELRRAKGDDVPMEPKPADLDVDTPYALHRTRCPVCTTAMSSWFERTVNGPDLGNNPFYNPDPAICVGGRRFTWLRCGVRVPHRHRRCDNCGAKWLEHAR